MPRCLNPWWLKKLPAQTKPQQRRALWCDGLTADWHPISCSGSFWPSGIRVPGRGSTRNMTGYKPKWRDCRLGCGCNNPDRYYLLAQMHSDTFLSSLITFICKTLQLLVSAAWWKYLDACRLKNKRLHFMAIILRTMKSKNNDSEVFLKGCNNDRKR